MAMILPKSSNLSSISVPLALVATITILMLPIPPEILDIGLALNFTTSIIILFVSLFMAKLNDFTSFPAVLLMTTLYRLALNVAATRLILLHGNEGMDAAGSVIRAFGEFVVGGNYVVGCVIFIAINIVNLKVITKGATRIAEVAARFTLDAMPGKQMAIDSDLNTGLIGEEEAKKRRKELAQEAEFYGAMDGAAKFVSGDAVAGLFITGINIVGGLFMGIVLQGMDWRVAAQTYTLLTIGDGLVNQIPAIVISTAAGLIVARAASSGADLGTEVFSQVLQSDKPLLIASAVCLGLAIVPGLPTLPFLVLSAASGGIGFMRLNHVKKEAEKQKLKELKTGPVDSKAPRPGSTEEVTGLLGVDTLELEVGYELVALVEAGDLVERIRSLRRQFALDYGFIVPAIHIRDNVRLRPSEYHFVLKGATIGSGELKSHHLLAMDPGNVTATVEGIPTKEPAFGLDALWIKESEKERAQFAGYTVVDPATVITTHITEMIRANMAELIGRQDVQHLVDHLAKDNPKVVDELIPNLLTLGQVQQVLANLLREQISIRDLRTIFETLADWAGTVKSPERLTEFVRRRLARLITSKYVTPEGMLPLVTLNPALERLLSEALQQTDEGSFLAMEPSLAQQLINKLNRLSEKFVERGQTPVLLAPSHLRPALFHFVAKFVPGYAVICHQEIAPNTKVQSMGVVAIEEMHRPAAIAANDVR